MKEVLEILEDLESSKKREVMDWLSQLQEDRVLLKDEQKDLLSSLDTLYKRNQQLHQKLEELRSRPSGRELIELAEENQELRLKLQRLQSAFDKVLSLLDI